MQLTEADLAAWPRRRRAALVNSLSGFKSANLLGTRSAAGQENLAMISSVFHLGADPALAGALVHELAVRAAIALLRHLCGRAQQKGC